MTEAFPAVVMPYLPLIIVHIAGGVIAILTGYTAVLVRKGETVHRAVGRVFVIAMLVTGGMATYLAISLIGKLPGQTGNAFAGVLVFYFISTAWVTVRRKENTIGVFEYVAFGIALALGALMLYGGISGLGTPSADGAPVAQASIALGIVLALAAFLDLKVIRKRGIAGAARIARHLWRMCLAFFIATGSFFLGQQKVMPVWMHGAWYLYVLAFAPLAFMIFWLIRVRIGNRFKGGTTVASQLGH